MDYQVWYTSSLNPQKEVEQIKPLISQITDLSTANSIKIIEPASKQTNGYDCGVYLIFYLQELLTTDKLELKNLITAEQCQIFRQE
jgi:Ulp1 family protease